MNKIHTVTIDCYAARRVTVNINELNERGRDFMTAWITDDEERTNKQREILDSTSLEEIFSDFLQEDVYEVEVYECD